MSSLYLWAVWAILGSPTECMTSSVVWCFAQSSAFSGVGRAPMSFRMWPPMGRIWRTTWGRQVLMERGAGQS